MNRLILVSFLFATALMAAPRDINLEVAYENGKTVWKPSRIEVTQGETVRITAKFEHQNPKNPMDFHGLFIPELKIQEQVYLTDETHKDHKPVVVERTIPASLKPGEYKVGCQFHEKHVPATLVVKPKN